MGDLFDTRHPLVAAPMAGGPTTVVLATAAIEAGAFAFIAGGNKTVEALAAEIDRMRGLSAPFGVNLFVPPTRRVDRKSFAAYAHRLQPEADGYGLELDPEPHGGDDAWAGKIDLLVREPVPVVSLTFGLPPRADVEALQRAGSRVLATVTSVPEAIAAERLGVDGLTVQGPRAGGHSAVHDPVRTPTPLETAELVRLVSAACPLPRIAAGGVDGPDAVAELLAAGASAVAVGTLLLRTDEAGTSRAHRAALDAARTRPDSADHGTVLTRAFTGRPARALHCGFIDRHDAEAPTGYPEVHHLTRELRQAAARAGDTERVHAWAGTGHRAAPEGPAAAVFEWLAEGLAVSG
ncbi:nitronate monooxygenase [Leucobacter sp. gxy201]|uniref:nitronate monooxygenase n=1 Tax=Leucobacter sp. gxy201 TaxID=2957200 RepID=UPI003DA09B47